MRLGKNLKSPDYCYEHHGLHGPNEYLHVVFIISSSLLPEWPDSHRKGSCPFSFAFCIMLYKWNHAVCDLWLLCPFAYDNYFVSCIHL